MSSRWSHYFSTAILVYHRGTPTWRFHTTLCKVVRKISPNISTFGQRELLKFGELSSLFTCIFYDFIYWFWILCFIGWQWKRSIKISLWGIAVSPDLVLFITIIAGVKHEGVACFACKQTPILGACWSCLDCEDHAVNLCTSCYMADEHDIQHVFQRKDSPKVPG